MVDAEPVTLGAKTGVFTSLWVALTPQVAKPNSLDRIHIMRCPIDRSRLVEICATSIKVADGQCTVSALRRERGDKRLPIRDFREQVWHIDADEPEFGEMDTYHSIGLGHPDI